MIKRTEEQLRGETGIREGRYSVVGISVEENLTENNPGKSLALKKRFLSLNRMTSELIDSLDGLKNLHLHVKLLA